MTTLKWILALCALTAVLANAGCASTSQGRFTLAEVDLREPEQITAAEPENTVVFDQENTVEAKAQAVSPDTWSKIGEVVAAIKGRIRLIHLEWAPRDGVHE